MGLSYASLFTGVGEISLKEVWQGGQGYQIFMISRVPRTLALILTGSGLSVAGFILQQIAQNKFAAPSTSGALDASKLGILFALIYLPEAGLMPRMFFALCVTFLASLLFMYIIQRIAVRNTVIIPLIGIMFGGILGAITTFFAYQHNIVQNTQEWLLGDFSSVMHGQYETLYLILPLVILAYWYADRFTIAGMGESFSRNLGLSYKNILYLGLLIVSLVISASVVTVGAIPFLGLVVPNAVRLVYGDHLRKVLPFTAFMGAIFLLGCDILGRLIVYPYEIPIGMMVGLIGGVLFIVLILRRKG